MEEKDAAHARSGISEELSKEIDAQHAIIHSAVKLINQLRHEPKKEQQSEQPFGEWAYNMKDLAYWIHHYTERKRLHCPKCKSFTTFTCQTCNEVYEYHDEL